MHITAAVVAFFELLTLAADTSAHDVIVDPIYTSPAQRIDIGSRRHINIYCTGNGTPTVVLEAGGASSIVVWGFVQPTIATTTRACAYDRAGLGFSDESSHPSTAANAVDDLHRLLAAASITPPYVLVAHSMGALISRLYAANFPEDVAGLVLIDPVSEYQTEAYWSVDPKHRSLRRWRDEVERADAPLLRRCMDAAAHGKLTDGSPLWHDCIDETSPVYDSKIQHAIETFESAPAYQRTALSEVLSLAASEATLLRAPHRFLGTKPLVVLTEGTPSIVKENLEPVDSVWPTLTARIAKWSTCNENILVHDVGHAIQLGRPDVVIAAIERVINAVRDPTTHAIGACDKQMPNKLPIAH